MLGITIEGWTLVFSALNTLAVIIAAAIALPQLVEISRTGRLEGTLAFIEKIRQASNAREVIYKSLPSDVEAMASLSPEIRSKAIQVINSLNELGVLLEGSMIDRALFFGVCHTMIIRCWYKLKPFAEYEEGRIGGRYARRIEGLDRRAKIYHDINPQHRVTAIKLAVGDESVVIYQTVVKSGVRELIQRIVWAVRRAFKWF
ncbi:MAG: hypothetical protein WBW48_00385 [Anaerolineae bacterium]